MKGVEARGSSDARGTRSIAGTARVREAMARDGLDAVIVSGNEYSGFEGAVTYMSGLRDRAPLRLRAPAARGRAGDRLPAEARYVGEHGTTWIDEQVFVDRPGEWLADRVRGQRVGVYGLDYVMTVRDFHALTAPPSSSRGTCGFDHARAVKSELELESVRDSVRINTEGFWIFLEHFAPGKTEREILAPCEEYFVEQGCGRLTMDMVLTGPNGAALPEFKIAGDYRIPRDRHGAAVARGRRPGRPLGRGLARDLPRYAERRDATDARGLRGVLRGRERGAAGRRDRARRRTAPCRRGSSTAASSSATSPGIRSG